MKATYIEYSETHSFSKTLLSYLGQDPNLEPFIGYWPTIENFKAVLENRQEINREVLVNTLTDQYAGYSDEASAPVHRNIQSLGKSTTFTITTGHQLNIFTGPLYFIYKIVTTINLARDLQAAYPDKHFVPVYWMATEDHDFAEINYCKIRGQKFSWDIDTSGATGRIDPRSIGDTLRAYTKALGLTENSTRLASIMEEAYLKHNTLADATRYLVHQLFAAYGLVVIDADHKDLKRQFADTIQTDIVEQKSFQAITSTSKALENSGFDKQVYAREINFFYLKDGLRERIVHENGKWLVLNTGVTFSKEDLTTEIQNHPDRFSPNVVMRPLYQEAILPNLAYVGGGAEIVYWLQLKQNFDQYGISFPMLIPRNSALLTGTSFSAKLGRLQLSHKDIFKSHDTLKREWVLAHSNHQLSITTEWEEMKAAFEKLKRRASDIDSTLTASTVAVEVRLRKALDNLERKMIKAEKRNHQEALTHIDQLKTTYFPGNGLQERVENFGPFYCQHGEQFIAALIKHFKPLEFKFTILEA
jgi:bacillithiol synthase